METGKPSMADKEDVEKVENAGGVEPVLSRTGEHLNPQPSHDPSDPLNWPLSLKVSR